MHVNTLIISLFLISLTGCDHKSKTQKIEPLEIKEDNVTPTVDIPFYTLMNPDRKKDAEEIMKVKRKWPLAMQSKEPKIFDSILSSNFYFKGGPNFYKRKEYIIDRTSKNEWQIIMVKYDNLTLQFFGDLAVLTYRNQVTNKNLNGAVEIEQMTWADIFEKQNNNWYIAATNAIDYCLITEKK